MFKFSVYQLYPTVPLQFTFKQIRNRNGFLLQISNTVNTFFARIHFPSGSYFPILLHSAYIAYFTQCLWFFRGSSLFMQAMRLWVGFVGDLIRSSNTYAANKVNIISSLHFFIEILSLRWVSENTTIFTLTISKIIWILFLLVGFGISSQGCSKYYRTTSRDLVVTSTSFSSYTHTERWNNCKVS